jgi:hypothetical protein
MQPKRRVGFVAGIMFLSTAVIAAPGLASGLVVTDLTSALTPSDLAGQLAGSGVAISNVSFVGDERAAGAVTGGDGIIGFDAGVILSSGKATDVVGPNQSSSTTTAFGLPGDPDLDELAGESVDTYDAAVLEFDFVPDGETVFFRYVFGSEEYNEYVSEPLTGVNDTFGFFVNGTNCATVPNPAGGTYPVTITTVNNGQPGIAPINSQLYINNDPYSPDSTGTTVPVGDLLDTEMDGLTVVLTCTAAVNEGVTNTMKLAIADGGDDVLDSWVLIQAGSLTTDPDPQPGTVNVQKVWIDADGETVTTTAPAGVVWSVDVTADGATHTLDGSSPSTSFQALPGTSISISESAVEGYTRVTGSQTVGSETIQCAGATETADFPGGATQQLTVCNRAEAEEPPPPVICEAPAAPAWAAHILKANGMSPQFPVSAPNAGKGKGGKPGTINLVASVAHHMGSGVGEAGTDFSGVPKDQQEAYGAAVRSYLESLTGGSLAMPDGWPPAECEPITEA